MIKIISDFTTTLTIFFLTLRYCVFLILEDIMKKFLSILIFLFPIFIFAVIGQGGISIAPDGTTLKWEEGAWDFFIMHKSVLERSPEHIAEISDDGSGAIIDDTNNPQADTLVNPSVGTTYRLTAKHIPPDADISRAFLIWLADVDPYALNEPTKNSVILTFTNSLDPSISYSQEVKANTQGNIAKDNKGMFEYEAVLDEVDKALNKEPYCSTDNGSDTGIYTYRVEVSDFMKKIIQMGEEKGMEPGEALYGDYNVKGIESSNHCYYMKQSSMVGGWALPFVYTSSHIRAKKIYFYHGLEVYQAKNALIAVNGFELPEDAVIRLGLVVFEGDPGRARVGNGIAAFPPEGLSISGFATPNDYKILYNKCNPPKTEPLNYTEIYNSISSIFGWQDSEETCIGNPDNPLDPSNPIEYAIDADTFIVDSRFPPFDTMFQKGDTQFGLKIGANQDQIFTNFLIVSVDTRPPQFDIPNEREKSFCSCASEADAVCFDRPFYYTIKIQNWGEDSATGVKLKDSLPPQVEYVPGTTEIARTINEQGLGTDWEPVPDVNGGFPFATPAVVADSLEHCSQSTSTCPQSAWVRFVVRPKSDLAKNEVIKNMAEITSNETPTAFMTNSNIPLRLKKGTCPAITECELPSKMQCGGVKVDDPNFCNKDEDCGSGKKCINNSCQNDVAGDLTKDAQVTFDMGANSPVSDDSAILIASGEGIVLGQFYLFAEGDKKKSYNFNELTIKFKAESDIQAKNFKLYKDTNGDGKVDKDDVEIAAADEVKNSYVKLAVLNPSDRLTPAGIKNHYIVTVDASTNSTSVPGKFNMIIENESSFTISDAGSAKVSGSRIDFVEYQFEPSEGFIITKGSHDPKIPDYQHFNGEHELLQVRTKSIGIADTMTSLTVKTTGSSVKFGEGMKSVSLILDKDKNGVQSAGDEVIAKMTSFENPATAKFDKIEIKYAENEEKYLIVKVDFQMKVGEKAKIQISTLKLKSGTAPVGNPVTSKEFEYKCDTNDPTSCASDDDGGCAITTVSDASSNTALIILAAFLAMTALAAFFVPEIKK